MPLVANIWADTPDMWSIHICNAMNLESIYLTLRTHGQCISRLPHLPFCLHAVSIVRFVVGLKVLILYKVTGFD